MRRSLREAGKAAGDGLERGEPQVVWLISVGEKSAHGQREAVAVVLLRVVSKRLEAGWPEEGAPAAAALAEQSGAMLSWERSSACQPLRLAASKSCGVRGQQIGGASNHRRSLALPPSLRISSAGQRRCLAAFELQTGSCPTFRAGGSTS